MTAPRFALLAGTLLTTPCIGNSFIVPQSFPTTGADLNFSQKNQILTAGYIPFKDAEIYHQIEIETAGLGQEIEELNEQAELEESQNQDTTPHTRTTDENPPDDTPDIAQNNDSPQGIQQPKQFTTNNNNNHNQPLSYLQQPQNINRGCSVYQPGIPSNQTLPLGHPLLKSDWNEKVNSSWFGYRWNKKDYHHGMDLACCGEKYYGKPVFSPADGTVSYVVTARPGKSCGNGISIKHANGLRTVYCHLKDKPLYKKGDHVSAGCQIGNVGHTGGRKMDKNPLMDITLSHLHYEIHYNGSAEYVTAPDNTKIKIVPGNRKKCKTCIDPTDWINYHYSE